MYVFLAQGLMISLFHSVAVLERDVNQQQAAEDHITNV